jgi:large subunit ribosomal protein L25
MFAIKTKTREAGEKLDVLRKSGFIPAVFYGAKQANTSVSVPTIDFKKVWRDAGESSAIKLTTDKGNVDVLIHDVQVDPITSEPIHVDFLAIDMNKAIRVNVPVTFEGISNAVKGSLGNLVKVLHEIEIEALPADLPHNLIADIAKLENVGDSILVSDIKLPSGVTAITHGSEVVASIVAQKEEVLEEAAPVDLSAIEVEKKGKKEEEGGEAAAEGEAK